MAAISDHEHEQLQFALSIYVRCIYSELAIGSIISMMAKRLYWPDQIAFRDAVLAGSEHRDAVLAGSIAFRAAVLAGSDRFPKLGMLVITARGCPHQVR
jgi:hypothetical protein